MYLVCMTNFHGMIKYEGHCLEEATRVAKNLGFQCYIEHNGVVIANFSPR